ncbi:hypothetical protein HYY72_02060 [Candidatus Woesearchaeota archaeon]|nr:hypothetical protein [Candidatus Woesearchaeota archaeon]
MALGLGLAFTIIIAIAAIFIAHKLLQEAFDFLHLGISIVGIVIAVCFIAVAYDAISFRSSFSSNSNLLAVRQDSSVTYAATITNGTGIEPVSSQELAEISAQIAGKDYKSALGKNYKLVIVEKELLSGGNNSSGLPGSPDSEMLYSFSRLMGNPGFFAASYKSGKIEVYPETLMFKAIRIVPVPGFDNFFNAGLDRLNVTAGI